MARNKKNKKKVKSENREQKVAQGAWHDDLHPETKKSIFAILFFVLAALTLLSYWGKAGAFGRYFFAALDWLVGRGYFFAPLTFVLIGFSLLFSYRRHLYAATLIGASLFLASTLGLTDLWLGDKTGGMIGFVVSYPLFRAFDFWATLVIEAAILISSLLIIFNTPLVRMFEKEEGEDEESAPEKKDEVEVSVSGIKTADAAEPPAPEPETKKPGREIREREKESRAAEEFVLDKKKYSAFAYQKPPLSLLNADSGNPSAGDIRANANIIKRTLQNFGIDVEMDEVSVGPTVTQYTLKPAEGMKLSRITALHSDLALALAAHPIRIEAPIPGKSLVGIEIPNRSIALVGLRSLFETAAFQNSGSHLLFALGRDVAGEPVYANLSRMPHIMIAGATGTGKSVNINTILVSFLYRNPPEILKFIMIDPKRVELTMFNGIPHLLTPVITDSKRAVQALRWAVQEMEKRYIMLSDDKVRDLEGYNAKIAKENNSEKPVMPMIVVVIDELADLMFSFPREVEGAIVRLAQMARAVGIHLIVSTQRPSVEVITGLIKANITSRIAFRVGSGVDSRTILDISGAEKLLGNGDMLFLAGDTVKPKRIQGAFVSEDEVKRVVQFIESHSESSEAASAEMFDRTSGGASLLPLAEDGVIPFDEFSGDDDELYEEARKLVIEADKASASYLQRRLKVGYARAARLLDMLEERGIIGPGDGAKPREILVSRDEVVGEMKDMPSDVGEDEEEVEEET
ncbi:DNA translocase FtsK [Patescibacteria group bacterium]|nr:DNA translocase FtsK [Patescibacteria group bacterium]